MKNNLNRVLWRHYRRRFLALVLITILVSLISASSDTGSWMYRSGENFFGSQINNWEVYAGTKGSFSFYPGWLGFGWWLVGIMLMNQDLKDNFNQFLFSSGYSRGTIYRHKLFMGLGGLLGLTVLATLIQYGVYWFRLQPGVILNLAWPGVLTGWAMGLASSLGLFAITWFAALIIGQTLPLLVTAGGFTFSLVGVSTIILHQTDQTNMSFNWTCIVLWLIGSLILLIWGAALYQRLSLENNGQYLLFPRLRMPVYVVFVAYLTALFVGNGEYLVPTLVTFIFATVFGYLWLWWPEISNRWQQRHAPQSRAEHEEVR